jgi:hypothetical protein
LAVQWTSVKGLISNSRQKTDCSIKRAMRRQLGGTMGTPILRTGSVGKLKAAAQALDAIGAFLIELRQARA